VNFINAMNYINATVNVQGCGRESFVRVSRSHSHTVVVSWCTAESLLQVMRTFYWWCLKYPCRWLRLLCDLLQLQHVQLHMVTLTVTR